MSVPPEINEGQLTTRTPLFSKKHNSWWKARMKNFLTVEDYELWTIVNRGPLTPTKQNGQNENVPKDPSEFVAADIRMMEKNAKTKKILICGLDLYKYNRISACSNAKEIWDALQTTHERTNQMKISRIELLIRNYELFSMKESEPIQEMMNRFTIITNELKSSRKVFTFEELVSKLELCKEKPKRDKALVLKASEEDESDNDELDLAIFAKFKRFMKSSKNASKRENNGKPKQIDKSSYDGYYKCNKLDHMVKDCPM
ncbi:uncharacterized protein [Nicotiana tomentosiformis]|uniref:uncharacterized protein n=1 Tax=Nicotiana tomentosiformis TaxID=4098 RepID=UPI00388C6F84